MCKIRGRKANDNPPYSRESPLFRRQRRHPRHKATHDAIVRGRFQLPAFEVQPRMKKPPASETLSNRGNCIEQTILAYMLGGPNAKG